MRKKDHLHKRAVSTRDQDHWKTFKRQCNAVSNFIKDSHSRYLNGVIGDSLTENPKKIWSYVKHNRTGNLGIPHLKTDQGVFVTDKTETWIPIFFLLLQMNNYLYLKFLELLTPQSLPYKHHPRELLNNYPMNYLHVYWERCLNSPFPRYFKRKGNRKNHGSRARLW